MFDGINNAYKESTKYNGDNERQFFSYECKRPEQREFLRKYRIANSLSVKELVGMMNTTAANVMALKGYDDIVNNIITESKYTASEAGRTILSPDQLTVLCYIYNIRSSELARESSELRAIVRRGNTLDSIKGMLGSVL